MLSRFNDSNHLISNYYSNDRCLIEDYDFFDDDEKALLEIEGFCESLPSCIWIGNKCQYSDENYCSGNDSYCEGMECCGEDGCCKNDVDGIVNLNKRDCNLLSSIDNHIWLPETYMDSTTCASAEYVWQDIDHGYEDYSTKGNCEDFNYEWVVVEYDDEESCEAVDLDEDGLSDHQWTIIYFEPDTTWSSWNPGHFTGLEYGDDLWGYPSFESPKLYESFTDYNVNGICDNEPFADADFSDANNNGICDETGDWTSRCPDILENCKNDTNSDGIINGDDDNCCINAVVVEAGYKASNITFPDDTPEIAFIIPDANNRGNGARIYNIVNEYDLPTDPVILRFEINAGIDPESYGDTTGSFATKNASLFIYEATSLNNFTPKNTFEISTQTLDSIIIDSLLGLPGASYESSGNISVPDYFVEEFRLLSIDNPLFESNFTEWFTGIQFRFDNGPNRLDSYSSVVLKKIEYSNSFLKNNLSYQPSILCTGAAIAFFTRQQVIIPRWVDKIYLGWLWRCFSNPRVFIPRYLKGIKLIFMLLKEPIELKEIK